MAIRNAIKYDKNPFIPELVSRSMSDWKSRVVAEAGDKILVDNATGEVEGARALITHEYVEKNKFLKLYSEGVGAMLDLNNAGKKVFKLVLTYLYSDRGKDKDIICLSYDLLDDKSKAELKRSTFYSGINDCIRVGIMAQTKKQGIFFLNPNYIFNGNRLALINSYTCTERAEDVACEYPLIGLVE